MVTVALHHALCTVVHCILPIAVAGDLSSYVVALHVCLVHTVESVGIEHGIHLRLAWIVAGAHGIDIRLLHQLHITQHGLQAYGTSRQWVGVLSVHALEVDSLSVDEHGIAAFCDIAEAIACRECHFLVAAGILLAYEHGIQVWLLAAPCLQA